jgi:short-subunit dehydrogenase
VLEADLARPRRLPRWKKNLRSDASITLLVNNAGIGTHHAATAKQGRAHDRHDRPQRHCADPPDLCRRAWFRGLPQDQHFLHRGVAPEVLNGVHGGSKAFVLAFASLHHELGAQGVQVQAVLPGATATDFWAIGGLPVEHLDPAIVMSAEQMVDAALVGFERGELVTIPSLHDEAAWTRFEGARQQMATQLSANTPAPRYVRTELH